MIQPDMLPTPSSSLVLRELTGIRREAQRIRNHLAGQTENEAELFDMPIDTSHLRLHVRKWMVSPVRGVAINIALIVSTRRVWTMATADGVQIAETPFTLENGTDVKVINAATGVRVDNDPAVILSSALLATVEMGREQQGRDEISGDV